MSSPQPRCAALVLLLELVAGCGQGSTLASSPPENDAGAPDANPPDLAAPSGDTGAAEGGKPMELVRHGIPEAAYQGEFERIVPMGYRLVWLDGYDVDGSTYFNAIFRLENEKTDWTSHHGLTSAAYQTIFDARVGEAYRLVQIETYRSFLSGGEVRYAPIFVRSAGPAFLARHDLNVDQLQSVADQALADGWMIVNVSGVAVPGSLVFAILFEKRDVGSYEARALLTEAAYQAKLEANEQAGRHLFDLNAFSYDGAPRFNAVWLSKAPGPVFQRRGMTAPELQAELERRGADGYLTGAVTGYQQGGGARFAAFWRR